MGPSTLTAKSRPERMELGQPKGCVSVKNVKGEWVRAGCAKVDGPRMGIMLRSTEYRPFIDDPAHVAQLKGQRYVVLRAAGALYDAYRRVETDVRRRLQGLPVSYPAEPHVTLV